jgi:acetylglutamate kinase
MMQEIQQQQEDILKSQLSISSRQELLSENIIQQKLLTKLLFKVINTVVVHGNVHQCNKVLKLLSISGLSQDTINEIDPIE